MAKVQDVLGWTLCGLLAARAGTAGAGPAGGGDGGSQLEEIVVTAALRPVGQSELPASITVLDAATLHDAGQQHLEDVLALVPNLNWAGDTSRPRYFQIRGIGELQQYQGAPNPSVAFLIDDIDFSGLGTAATLFDVDHVEVLRGPQGTLYGANALAGLIYVQSAAPSDTFGARAELDGGDYGERSYGAAITGPLTEHSAVRLAAQRYQSDGFYHNAYLGRGDVDARDEVTVRGRWRYDPDERLRIDVSILRVQIDNGYDAWSIDNTRTTESDDPSVDVQNSTGISARAAYTFPGAVRLTAIATHADSVIHYGYDGDWGNPILWAPYTYEYTEYQVRHRFTDSLELRLAGTRPHGLSWLAGLYGFELREALGDTSAGFYLDPFDATQNSDSLTIVNSRYRSENGALYGQFDGDLGAGGRWSLGLRGERRDARYDDRTSNLDAPDTSNAFQPTEDMWGGHASLDWTIGQGEHVYALIARGYKAGGFNLSQGLAPGQQTFGPEWDLNFEFGQKGLWADGRLRVDTALFYMQRHAEQLLTSTQSDPDNPDEFVYYTGNARSGYNYGVEQNAAWQVSRSLEFGVSLGWLQTLYRGFIENGAVLPDRALPSAPDWQAAVNATWRPPRGMFARLDVTGMGAFYYDLPPNPTRSSPYGLVNAKLGWSEPRFEVYVWGRNLTNKNYTVRGFYFGDEPPNFPYKLYTQLGEPLNWGVHFMVRY